MPINVLANMYLEIYMSPDLSNVMYVDLYAVHNRRVYLDKMRVCYMFRPD